MDTSSKLWKIIFDNLQPKEQEKWKAFAEKHKSHGRHCSGNGLSVEVSPDSIGDYVIVMKCSCGAKENITDFSAW
jgi:hypothetical protein